MRHFLRYSTVGAFATATHYLMLVAAVELADWPAYLGSGVGAVVGAQVAYAGNRWFTFGHRGAIRGENGTKGTPWPHRIHQRR